jgi:hypothetical protein
LEYFYGARRTGASSSALTFRSPLRARDRPEAFRIQRDGQMLVPVIDDAHQPDPADTLAREVIERIGRSTPLMVRPVKKSW